MWFVIYQSLKALAGIILVVFLIVAYLLLSGCGTTDGPGFHNSGKPSRPACVERDAKGNERWHTC